MNAAEDSRRAATCEHLPATPRFDRDAWTRHPHFPEQLLLLGSHRNFIRISETLVTRARALTGEPSASWRDDTLYLFSWWQSGMKSHEHYEEHKLYPYLAQRYCVSLGALVADHGELDERRPVVQSAIAAGSAASLREALTGFDATLLRHLRAEEDVVIPMLLDLEQSEFRRYASANIRDLLSAPATGGACVSCG